MGLTDKKRVMGRINVIIINIKRRGSFWYRYKSPLINKMP